MYTQNHKLSPPVQSAISPRTIMSNLDNGYSSTHHRSRGENGRAAAADSDSTERPNTPPELGGTVTSPTAASVSASSSSLSSALFGLKKGRLLYSQPESPKAKKKGRGLLSSLLDSKHSQSLFLSSLVINLLLFGVLVTSLTRSSPLCLHNPSPLHANDLLPNVVGLRNIDTGNTDLARALTHNEQQPPIAALGAEVLPIVTPVSPPTTTNTEPVASKPAEEQPAAAVQQEVAPLPASPADVPAVVDAVSPQPISAIDRPFADDISENVYNVDSHTITWQHCLVPAEHLTTFTYAELGNLTNQPVTFLTDHCPVKPTVEQVWQIGWYGGQVAVGVSERNFPLPQKCVHLPPDGYVWPKKYTDLPAADQSFLNWPNLRVDKYEDLIIFNQATPKNLYHFNAPQYDLDGLSELSLGATYIPFNNKIRNFLDIGAGGGSLGLLLKRKYGVEAMSIIFPDWPYCEYITERGGLCVLVDVMEAMPFARASFDAVHISWVYHGQQPAELIQMYTEIDRIVRPGGYVWQRGGWSMSQIDAQKRMFDALGYVQLYEKLERKPEDITRRVSFGPNLPFEAEWTCIYVKPIRAVRKVGCDSAPELVTVRSGS